MTFKQKVAEYFPLARSASLLCFSVLFISYHNDPNDTVGACMLGFGTASVIAITLTPTTKGPPS
jgi:hypothetical protein